MLVSESYVCNIQYDEKLGVFTGEVSFTLNSDAANDDKRHVHMSITIQRPYNAQISKVHSELLTQAFAKLESGAAS